MRTYSKQTKKKSLTRTNKLFELNEDSPLEYSATVNVAWLII